MASTFVLTVKTTRSQADVNARLKRAASDPRQAARLFSNYFEAIGAGTESASIDFQNAAAAPVRASGTITLVYASIANNDTVTIAGTVLTCVTGTPTANQFKKVTDGPTTATNLVALINAHATLSKLGVAKSAASVVTFTCNVPGIIGNLLTLATSNGAGFTLSGAVLASGAGGSEIGPVTYTRGL